MTHVPKISLPLPSQNCTFCFKGDEVRVSHVMARILLRPTNLLFIHIVNKTQVLERYSFSEFK